MNRNARGGGDRRENAQPSQPRANGREDGTNPQPRRGRRENAHNFLPRGSLCETGKPSQVRGGHRGGSSPRDGAPRNSPSHSLASYPWSGFWLQQWNDWRRGNYQAGNDSKKMISPKNRTLTAL